jgi:hypothetical protein
MAQSQKSRETDGKRRGQWEGGGWATGRFGGARPSAWSVTSVERQTAIGALFRHRKHGPTAQAGSQSVSLSILVIAGAQKASDHRKWDIGSFRCCIIFCVLSKRVASKHTHESNLLLSNHVRARETRERAEGDLSRLWVGRRGGATDTDIHKHTHCQEIRCQTVVTLNTHTHPSCCVLAAASTARSSTCREEEKRKNYMEIVHGILSRTTAVNWRKRAHV